MDDKTKEFINVSLTEYRELRCELRDLISRQFLIISLTITVLSTLFGFYFKNENANSGIIFSLLIPCLSAFSGILWLDCIYRQVKIGTYVASIEDKINALFEDNEKIALNWEHYADEEAKNSFIKKVNHWQYYFGLAFYFLMPILSGIYSLNLLNDKNTFLYYFLILSSIMYVCFVLFVFGYLKVISINISKLNGSDLFKKSLNIQNQKKEH